MNAIEFVEMLNNRVRNSVVSIVESDLESPNCNYETLLQLSKWYNSKDQYEKQVIHSLITRVYDCAAFRFLCMLDCSAFRLGLDSYYELNYFDGIQKTSIVDSESIDDLHDYYVADFKK